MKHKIFTYAIIPAVLGLGLFGINFASAHGLFGGFGNSLTPDEIATQQITIFQNEAQILGLSIDEVKDAWAQGKTFSQIATDKGMTQDQLQTKLKDYRTQQIKSQLKTLVDKGVITQGQADKRLQTMQTQLENGKNRIGKRFFMGLHF